MFDTKNGWIEVNVNNKAAHPEGDHCTQVFAVSPCHKDSCTLTFFADQLRFLADVFNDPNGHTTDYKLLSEAGARGMANMIATIRQVAWEFTQFQSDDWNTALGLLDLAAKLLRTQYRDPDKPGVHLTNEAAAGLQSMFLAVEYILRRQAEQLGG